MTLTVYAGLACVFLVFQASTAQCPTSEWKFNNGNCYLFRMDNNEDIHSWGDALSMCKSFSSNASLVTMQNDEEFQYVYSNMLEETVPSIETNSWIGMYKEGFGSPYIWENGEPVGYTRWAPGEPNDQDGTQNCVRMYSDNDGLWDDYFCDNAYDENFIGHGYMCKLAPVLQTIVVPQYEFALNGNFTSVTGGDFTLLCTQAYAESMNSRAKAMTETVNSLVGSEICPGMTTDQMRLTTVSATLTTNQNTWLSGREFDSHVEYAADLSHMTLAVETREVKGRTFHFYIAEVGLHASILQVENCAMNMSDYLSLHSNWDDEGEVLPPEEGCPGVQFTEQSFAGTGNQWLCVDPALAPAGPSELANAIEFNLSHNAVFQSVDGSDITASCLSAHNNRFVLDTLATAQSVSTMIGNTLCPGKDIAIGSSTASLVLSGNQQGGSIQTYRLQPGLNMTFAEVESCSYEVSGYLGDHSNWESLLPPVDGCADLAFTTTYFALGETHWVCV